MALQIVAVKDSGDHHDQVIIDYDLDDQYNSFKIKLLSDLDYSVARSILFKVKAKFYHPDIDASSSFMASAFHSTNNKLFEFNIVCPPTAIT